MKDVRMTPFRPIPELDWLKDLARESSPSDTGEKLTVVYRYLLWLRRANLADPQTDEHTIAMGLSTKYNRWLYDMPINDFEQRYIDDAEKLFKKVKSG